MILHPEDSIQTYKGETVLVAGASSGVGLAMANSLARRGAHVILTAGSTDKLNEAAVAIEKTGARASVFSCDLSQPGGVQDLHDEVKQCGHEVDLLINNAGYGRWSDWESLRQTNR